MSGGHFDYQQWHIQEIAETIERDIALALKPKPQKVHKDYWNIYVGDNPHSCHPYHIYMTFSTYKEAEEFLLSRKRVRKTKSQGKNLISFFANDIIFESVDECMHDGDDWIDRPMLYAIHHAVYDHYPYDEDVLELEGRTIETMKEAYRQIRIAGIYAQRVDWMMSGDDSEDTMQERLNEELEEFYKEFQTKDWDRLSLEDNDY